MRFRGKGETQWAIAQFYQNLKRFRISGVIERRHICEACGGLADGENMDRL
jgi:hypothetical protein